MSIVFLLFCFLSLCLAQDDQPTVDESDLIREGFFCRPGEVVRNIITTYIPEQRKRVFWFRCIPFSVTANETCQAVLPTQEPDSDDWTVTCPGPNFFINGIARVANYTDKENGTADTFIYLFKCCEVTDLNSESGDVETKRIVTQTCRTKHLVHAGQTRFAEVTEKGVIVAAHTVYNASLNDRTWILTICQFADELDINEEAYVKFPSNQVEPFGSGPQYRFNITCPKLQFLRGIDSIYGYLNKDRGFYGVCGNISQDDVKCNGYSRYQPRSKEAWHRTGCRGQQLVTQIDSAKLPDRTFRLLEFTCCDLKEPIINETACTWLKVTDSEIADFSFYLLQDGYVLRGIAAEYYGFNHLAVRLEICRLNGFNPPGSQCLYGYTDPSPVEAIEGSFLTYNWPVERCAIECEKFPFCESIRYTFGGVCHFTFVRQQGTCPTLAPLPKFKLGTDVWIKCAACF